MRSAKPNFKSVVDLGLRDVGIRTDARRFMARVGKASLAVGALVVLSAIALCAILTRTGADTSVLVAYLLAWPAVVLVLAVRAAKRAPTVVVKVTAEGTNQAVWLLMAPLFLFVPYALLVRDPLVIPVVALSAIMAVVVLRARGYVPEALRRLRGQLAASESVLGDGIGLVRGARGRDALRLVVATDRRLLVASGGRSESGFLLVDVPYRDVSRFGIAWKQWGRVGELSLTVAGTEDTHVITSFAPLNLLSIAQALRSHGVEADDPAVLADAEAAWEEAQRGDEVRPRLLDRAAMSTREFDHGLWLLMALSAFELYLNPLRLGPWAFPVFAALCVMCGYTSGTRSSLAYIVPLNLLLTPLFFLIPPNDVILLMFALSAVAALGLWAGSALRERRAAGSGRPVDGSGLRRTLGGLSLVRISGAMLAVVLGLVTTAAAAGFELTSLKLAVDEATVEQRPVDGRSNLTGNAASLRYTPGPGLREFITDEHWDGGPNDGARWELRSSFRKGQNFVSLAHYIFEPRLDDPAAVAEFVADKDDEHSRIAGHRVSHTQRVVDGRTGYVWTHGNRAGYWHYAVWFPQAVHTVRVECVAKRDLSRFKRLCNEALESLEFHQ
jgi:hypothetical protein